MCPNACTGTLQVRVPDIDKEKDLTVSTTDPVDLIGRRVRLPYSCWDDCETENEAKTCFCVVVGCACANSRACQEHHAFSTLLLPAWFSPRRADTEDYVLQPEKGTEPLYILKHSEDHYAFDLPILQEHVPSLMGARLPRARLRSCPVFPSKLPFHAISCHVS